MTVKNRRFNEVYLRDSEGVEVDLILKTFQLQHFLLQLELKRARKPKDPDVPAEPYTSILERLTDVEDYIDILTGKVHG